jgi:hypothetical protein
MIAKEWNVPPWIVDQAPWYEVETVLTLLRIESDVAAWKKQAGR